jgi:hypothetical protein
VEDDLDGDERSPSAPGRLAATPAWVVKDFAFNPPLVSILRGATLRWSFRDPVIHGRIPALLLDPPGADVAGREGQVDG